MTHPLLAIDNLSIAFRQQGETQTVVHLEPGTPQPGDASAEPAAG